MIKNYIKYYFVTLLTVINLGCMFYYIQKSGVQQRSDKPLKNIHEERKLKWIEVENSFANKNLSKHLPKTIGIGVKKCGTGALITFLRKHPMIRVGKHEQFFFTQKNGNLNVYRNNMPLAPDNTLSMEKTPGYFFDSLHPPVDISFKIHSMIPGVKLLLILCDPVARVYSDYAQEVARFRDFNASNGMGKYKTFKSYFQAYYPKINKTFDACSHKEDEEFISKEMLKNDYLSTLITNGLYEIHLRRWLQVFNSSNLMIIDGLELFNNPGKVLVKIQKFLGIPTLLLPQDFVRDQESPSFHCFKDWKTEKQECLPPSKKRTKGGNVKRDPVIGPCYKKLNRFVY